MKYVLILILTNTATGTADMHHIPDYPSEQACDSAKNIWIWASGPAPHGFERSGACLPQ